MSGSLKLSFSTLGSPDWSFERTVEEAARLGFDGIEIRGIGGALRAGDMEPFRGTRRRASMRLAADAGVELCCFGSSASFHEPASAEASLAEAKSDADLCADLGIPFLRVFGDALVPGESLSDTAERIAGCIGALCAHCRSRGVAALLEVHGDFNTAERIGAVCALLRGESGFGILWDVAHSDRSCGDDYAGFYAGVKPLLRHVHVKDHLRAGGAFRLCPVGSGDIPIPGIVELLGGDGYAGYYSLEWEKRWHPELDAPERAYPEYAAYMRSLERAHEA